MIVALTLIPVMIAGGAGIDLARTLAARTALQAALDAASLAVATSNPATLSHDQQTTIAQNYFNANYRLDSSFGAPAPVTVTVTDSTAVVSTSTTVPTTLMRIALIDSVPLNTSSTVTWGQTKLWVSLVLDNTGSMNDDGKMDALKTATHQLLTLLQNASANAGDVKVALVPFVKDVNVGSGNYNQSWIYWGNTTQDPDKTDNTSWDALNGSCSAGGYTSRSNCITRGSCSVGTYSSQSSCTSGGVCSVGSYSSQSTCTNGGTCSVGSYTSQSACTGGGTCSISGYTSSSTCTAATTGTCSISGYTTQSSCQAAGVCSISGYTTSSTCTAATSGSCSISGYSSQSSCTAAGICSNPAKTTSSNCTSQRACTLSSYTSQSSCQAHGGTWGYGTWTSGVWTISAHGVWTTGVWNVTGHGVWTAGVWTAGVWTAGVWTANTWAPADHSTWTGCVTDRGYPKSSSYLTIGGSNKSGPDSTNNYDASNAAPVSTSPSSLFPAEQYSSCPQAILPLTYDWGALSNEVDNMTPNGGTNQTIGLAWGWHALTNTDPLNPGTMPANTTPIMILMSDGLNTQDRWYGNGSTQSSQVDGRMSAACTNFKNWAFDNDDKRPIIYTVQVDTGGDGVSTVLQNCATDTSKYYHLTSAGATVTAFNQIGAQITNMRISH